MPATPDAPLSDEQVDAIAVNALEALDSAIEDALEEVLRSYADEGQHAAALDALTARVYDAVRGNLEPGW